MNIRIRPASQQGHLHILANFEGSSVRGDATPRKPLLLIFYGVSLHESSKRHHKGNCKVVERRQASHKNISKGRIVDKSAETQDVVSSSLCREYVHVHISLYVCKADDCVVQQKK